MKRFAIALLAAAALLPAAAQATQKLSAGKTNEYGLIYSLPVTSFDITVVSDKVIETPGEFYRYAGKYLGIDPITAPSTTYSLSKVIVTPRAIPSDDEKYLVQFKSGSTPFMILSDTNFPLAINTEQIAATEPAALPESTVPEPSVLESPAARQAMTAEMLQSTSTAKRAELAAARIFELRQSRSDIISGSADNMPSDGKAMQLALDNLGAQEAALTAMFAGTRQTATEVSTFTYTPSADTDNLRTVIARISSFKGIVDAADLSGEPIYLYLQVIERGKLPVNEKGEQKRFPKGGFAYCIPGSAQITVSDFSGSKLLSQNFDVAQFGVVFGLDPNLFTDKKAPAYAILNPLTGAITEIGTVQ